MGVIKRQGIKHSIVRYIGIVIGAVNLLYFYPLFLGKEKLGLVNFLINTATLAHTFVLLGVVGVSVKFFPNFRDELNKHNNFLSFLLLWILFGFFLFLIVIYLLKSSIIGFYRQKSSEYLQFLPYVIPLVFVLSFQTLLIKYISNFKRIVVPNIIVQLYKIVTPSLACLYFLDIITLTWLIKGIILYFISAVIFLLFYLKHLGQLKIGFRFSFIKKPLLKEIFTYAGYGILGSVGSILAVRIDGFMVSSLIDLGSNGIYTVALFIATVISVPSKAVISITGPLIAQKIADNKMEEIGLLYKKTSIILWTIGLLCFLGIWLNLDSLFSIMPDGESYAKGKLVVLILGCGILFDLLTSVNGDIIAYSKYFKFNFITILILAAANIGFNFWLIPIHHILGAAMATTLSLFLYNLLKVIFIYYKFNLLPFSMNTLKVLLIAFVTYFLVTMLPSVANSIIDIFLRSAVICLLYIPSVLYFQVSEDLTSTFKQTVRKIWK